MKKILIPLANGFEEIEASVAIDVLRRAGLEVVTAGLPGTMVTGSRDVKFIADEKFDDVNPQDFDALVLVGGNPGYVNLSKSQKVAQAVKDFDAEKKTVAAICGAPTVLVKAGIMENRRATIYPGMERELPMPRNGRVVADEHVITSQSPGTAIEFALKLVEVLAGSAKAEEVRMGLAC